MTRIIDFEDPIARLGLGLMEEDLRILARKLLDYEPSKGREKEMEGIRDQLKQLQKIENIKSEGGEKTMEPMKQLYEKVAGDLAMQERFNQILSESEAAGKEATEEKLLGFARKAGYEVSLEEMLTFFEGMATQASGELSDVELDQVAGGKVNPDHVIASVFSLGLTCAIGSIIYATRGNCEDFFHE